MTMFMVILVMMMQMMMNDDDDDDDIVDDADDVTDVAFLLPTMTRDQVLVTSKGIDWSHPLPFWLKANLS